MTLRLFKTLYSSIARVTFTNIKKSRPPILFPNQVVKHPNLNGRKWMISKMCCRKIANRNWG